jgi:hypothetical protein
MVIGSGRLCDDDDWRSWWPLIILTLHFLDPATSFKIYLGNWSASYLQGVFSFWFYPRNVVDRIVITEFFRLFNIPLGRMAGGSHGLPKFSPIHAIHDPSTPCGRATPETALWPSSTLLDTPRRAPIVPHPMPRHQMGLFDSNQNILRFVSFFLFNF